MNFRKCHWLFLFLLPLFLSAQFKEQISLKEAEIEQLSQGLEKKKEELAELKLELLRNDMKTLGYPISPFNGELVEHSAMALEYVEKHEQASWVYHIILPDIITGNEGRTNIFMPDPKVSTGSTVEQDYFLKHINEDGEIKYDGFGYDRGHLAPSADFRWNPKALAESYYYSNMSPQLPNFNRGTWSDVESLLRKYIFTAKNQLYVVTGGVLEDDLPVLERSINKVTIPRKYYKVAVDPVEKKGIAFLVPNQKELNAAETYVTSIGEIEKLTGITFFPNLSDRELYLNQNNLSYFLNSDFAKSEFPPLDPTKLPKKTFNSVQAKIYAGKEDVITVCGTVAGKFLSKKGNVFLNFEKPYPDQLFSVFINGADLINFSFDPTKEYFKQCICVTGKVDDFRGTPTMFVKKQEQIRFCGPFK